MSLSGKSQRRVFVGGSTTTLAAAALSQYPDAWLVDVSNWSQYVDDCSGTDTTVYTSVADMSGHVDRLLEIMLGATQIVYVPEPQWLQNNLRRNIYDVQHQEQGMLESLIIQASRHVPVIGLEHIVRRPAVLDLVGHRQTESPQLWATGCSNTVAVGVQAEQSWARTLARQLDVPVSVLALAGSSITWAADQILRSDIRSKDTVVWGLTNPNRQYIFHEDRTLCLTSVWYDNLGRAAEKIYPRRLVLGQHPVYSSFQAIAQVKNFCARAGAQLIMFNTLPVNADLDQYLLGDPDYHVLDENFSIDGRGQRFLQFRDRGTDGCHPGPEQHRVWAQSLVEILCDKIRI